MKSIFSILMITAILLPSLSKFWIYVDFKLRQDFIAEVFCINQEEPVLMCSGKCYLNEKLQEADEREQQQRPFSTNEKRELNYYLGTQISALSKYLPSNQMAQNPLNYQSTYQWTHQNEIFHPPRHTAV